MRIAFSGTHRSGKSTLLEHVSDLLPRHITVDEPYYLLEEEGYKAAERPSIDDFQAQLERSLSSLEEGDANVLFDRCPADTLAYLLTHDEAAAFDVEKWLERVRDALKTLDLVVFVPVEAGDRIAVPSHEDRDQRMSVHEKLAEMLLENPFGFDVEVLRVEGDVESRVQQVMARVKAGRHRRRPRSLVVVGKAMRSARRGRQRLLTALAWAHSVGGDGLSILALLLACVARAVNATSVFANGRAGSPLGFWDSTSTAHESANQVPGS